RGLRAAGAGPEARGPALAGPRRRRLAPLPRSRQVPARRRPNCRLFWLACQNALLMAAIDETLDPRGAVLHDATRSPAVELRDVTVVYPGGNVGLDGASVAIGRGEFAFLVGQTGCGKSTFIKLLLREIDPARGKVLIAGHDITALPRRKIPKLRRNIGVVFQDYKLLPNRTVYANVAYALEVIGEPRASIRRKVPDILRLVGLST